MAKKEISVHDNPFIEETLKENEKRANEKCCRVFLVLLFAMYAFLFCTLAGIFGVATTKYLSLCFITILGMLIMLNNIDSIKSGALKIINLFGIIALSTIADYFSNYNATIVIAFPIVLSALYFSQRTVAITSFITVVAFTAETYLAAKHCVFIDANHVAFPEGTVIVVKDTLKKAIYAAGFDVDVYVDHMMLLALLPKLILLAVIISTALAIARYGQSMLVHQASVTAEHTRIDTELDLANQMQAHALPKVADLNGKYNFELAASMKAARETGGDFYDFTMLDDSHLALVIADVCDKGVPAAMFMMSAKASLNSCFSVDKSPSEILAQVNNSLCSNNSEDMFVTVWLGIIDLETGVMRSANAGHENPILSLDGGEFFESREKHGMFLGEFEGLKYVETEYKLKAGDVLYLYTDGVTEAKAANNDMYGMDRLLKHMNETCGNHSEMTAYEIKKKVQAGIKEFVGTTEQSDDITMLVMKML